jgi:hypothetical protein
MLGSFLAVFFIGVRALSQNGEPPSFQAVLDLDLVQVHNEPRISYVYDLSEPVRKDSIQVHGESRASSSLILVRDRTESFTVDQRSYRASFIEGIARVSSKEVSGRLAGGTPSGRLSISQVWPWPLFQVDFSGFRFDNERSSGVLRQAAFGTEVRTPVVIFGTHIIRPRLPLKGLWSKDFVNSSPRTTELPITTYYNVGFDFDSWSVTGRVLCTKSLEQHQCRGRLGAVWTKIEAPTQGDSLLPLIGFFQTVFPTGLIFADANPEP